MVGWNTFPFSLKIVATRSPFKGGAGRHGVWNTLELKMFDSSLGWVAFLGAQLWFVNPEGAANVTTSCHGSHMPHGAMDQHFPGVIHTLSTNPEPINRECRSEPQYGPDKGGESGTYIYGSTEITVYYIYVYILYIYILIQYIMAYREGESIGIFILIPSYLHIFKWYPQKYRALFQHWDPWDERCDSRRGNELQVRMDFRIFLG